MVMESRVMQETSNICQKSQRDHLLNIAKHPCLLSAECTKNVGT